MQIIDLTHVVSPHMPVYPGTEPPLFTIEGSIEKSGFQEKKITFFSHTGTHIDAPAHIIQGAKTLDRYAIECFFGRAMVLNASGITGSTIAISDFEPHQTTIGQVDFLLIHTGWNRYWGSENYFSGYPMLSEKAAVWLAETGLKGIGMDTISVDPSDSLNYPVHKILLRSDMIIVENLTNLDQLPYAEFYFSCFPIKIEEADGAPVRAVAIICK